MPQAKTLQKSEIPTMTRRYFYTDPLAAAWMAKHFGMEFSFRNEINPNGKVGLPAIESHISHGHLQLEGGRFYIHPDSLHLLGPRDGDINIKGLVYMHCSYHDKMLWVDLYCGNYCEERGQTIRRNGTPFMWPESEAL
jgi:hypothetical protein